jgi:hypothetical protein
VTATAANVHDLDEAVNLVRAGDEVVYADAGYQGAANRPEIAGDEHLSKVAWQIAARKGVLKTMAAPDRVAQSRQASVRAKVEHPFLIVKRDFGFTKTRYPRLGQEPEPLTRAVRLRELPDARPGRHPDGVTATASACPETPRQPRKRGEKPGHHASSTPIDTPQGCPRNPCRASDPESLLDQRIPRPLLMSAAAAHAGDA